MYEKVLIWMILNPTYGWTIIILLGILLFLGILIILCSYLTIRDLLKWQEEIVTQVREKALQDIPKETPTRQGIALGTQRAKVPVYEMVGETPEIGRQIRKSLKKVGSSNLEVKTPEDMSRLSKARKTVALKSVK
jgi:hypothetical protein